jgi:3-methyladenine DNA glycosylase AlkC
MLGAHFLNLFCPDFIELYGLNYREISIPALAEFTQYASSELAIRPFIVLYQDHMMTQMLEWAKDDNYHIRRLASEGCRPRLPWAVALSTLKKDPSDILPILYVLKDDKEEYVTRSVANNLNDISKDNPDIVLDIAKEWYGGNKNTDRLVKHACRSLLKSANLEALDIFGFNNTYNTEITNLSISRPNINNANIKIGEEINFLYELNVKNPGKLRLEYAIDFMKSNGKASRKIFQLKEGNYTAGAFSFSKKHSFKERSIE